MTNSRIPESEEGAASVVAAVEVLPPPRRASARRVFRPEEKRLLVEEASQPGNSVSAVARKYAISSSLLFRWKLEQGSMSGLDEAVVVPESVLKEAKQRIRELERLLGRKTLENEILKDAWSSHAQKN